MERPCSRRSVRAIVSSLPCSRRVALIVCASVPECLLSALNFSYVAAATLKRACDFLLLHHDGVCTSVLARSDLKLISWFRTIARWGTLIRHAAKFYGAKATGVTLAVEGKKFCDDASKETGVPTDILFCDYRDIPAEIKFDKIASIEMAEHVGIANFVDPYLSSVRRLMKRPDSSFLLQVSGLRQGANWQDVAWGLFMSKYIFPGADASTPLNWYVIALGARPCFEHVRVDEAVGGAASSECAVSYMLPCSSLHGWNEKWWGLPAGLPAHKALSFASGHLV